MIEPTVAPILIAACGNALAGDDAFGPLVAEAVAARGLAGVEVVNLGMRPTGLLDYLPGRRALLVVDAAICPGHAVGEWVELDFLEVQAGRAGGGLRLGADCAGSTHAISVSDQLALGGVLGVLPGVVRLLLLVVGEPKMGEPPVLAQAHARAGVDRIAHWVQSVL